MSKRKTSRRHQLLVRALHAIRANHAWRIEGYKIAKGKEQFVPQDREGGMLLFAFLKNPLSAPV